MFVCIKKSIVMDISLRTQQLNNLFSYDKKAHLEESRLEIIPFRFTQTIGASEINEFQKELGTDKRFPPLYPTFCSKRNNQGYLVRPYRHIIFELDQRIMCHIIQKESCAVTNYTSSLYPFSVLMPPRNNNQHN